MFDESTKPSTTTVTSTDKTAKASQKHPQYANEAGYDWGAIL